MTALPEDSGLGEEANNLYHGFISIKSFFNIWGGGEVILSFSHIL